MSKDPAQRYKEKKCPVCGVLHKKRWPCCSYECSHELKRGNKLSEETKEKISVALKKWKNTDEGELTNMNLLKVYDEDNMVLPPIDMDHNGYIEDGDIWIPQDYK